MSNALLVCLRNSTQPFDFRRYTGLLAEALTPDNIEPRPSYIKEEDGVHIAVFNPTRSVATHGLSLCLGKVFDESACWWKPNETRLDGTYAIFRGDKDRIELSTDIVASRTIWYIQTKTLFIASTSQRAIVAVLGSFDLNHTAVAWLLSSGMLGPSNSWDQRISTLPPDTQLVLDRATWTLTINRERPTVTPVQLPHSEHERRLRRALEETFESLNLDRDKWVLPLSGGHDSRAVFLFLKEKMRLRCITWGLSASLDDETNDAYIARALAKHFGVEFQYLNTDLSPEPTEKLFHRYIVAGEGRIDHIPAYMDGFHIWKLLFEQGVDGIIRGDQGFGSSPVRTSLRVRRYIGLVRLSDYSNLDGYKTFDLPEQVISEELCRFPHESLSEWRDRLYLEVRYPLGFSALTDLKSPYVEVVNPLLSRRLINQIQSMPSSLKTNRTVIHKIVEEMSPKIPFAKTSATASKSGLMTLGSTIDVVREELRSRQANAVLSKSLLSFLERGLSQYDQAPSDRPIRRERRFLPAQLLARAKNKLGKPIMDVNVLSFRAYMACKMSKILSEDARLL